MTAAGGEVTAAVTGKGVVTAAVTGGGAATAAVTGKGVVTAAVTGGGVVMAAVQTFPVVPISSAVSSALEMAERPLYEAGSTVQVSLLNHKNKYCSFLIYAYD